MQKATQSYAGCLLRLLLILLFSNCDMMFDMCLVRCKNTKNRQYHLMIACFSGKFYF